MVAFLPSNVRPFFPNSEFQKGEKEAWAAFVIEFLRTEKGDTWTSFTWNEIAAFIHDKVVGEEEEVVETPVASGRWNWLWVLLGFKKVLPIAPPKLKVVPEVVLNLHPVYQSLGMMMMHGVKMDDMINALHGMINDGYLSRKDEGNLTFLTVTDKFMAFYTPYVVRPSGDAEVVVECVE